MIGMASPRRCLRCGYLIPETHGSPYIPVDIECTCSPITFCIGATASSNTIHEPKEEKKKQQKGNFRREFGGVKDRLDKRFK
jgi:hypothetical protein